MPNLCNIARTILLSASWRERPSVQDGPCNSGCQPQVNGVQNIQADPVFWQATRNLQQRMLAAWAFFQTLQWLHLSLGMFCEIERILPQQLLVTVTGPAKLVGSPMGELKVIGIILQITQEIEHPKLKTLGRQSFLASLANLAGKAPF